MTDLIGSQINVMFDNISNVLPHVKSNKLRALAVTTPARSPLAPEVPTVIEAGVPGYELGVWFGIAAPGGTPRPIVDKLNAEIVKILRMPDVKEEVRRPGRGGDRQRSSSSRRTCRRSARCGRRS